MEKGRRLLDLRPFSVSLAESASPAHRILRPFICDAGARHALLASRGAFHRPALVDLVSDAACLLNGSPDEAEVVDADGSSA